MYNPRTLKFLRNVDLSISDEPPDQSTIDEAPIEPAFILHEPRAPDNICIETGTYIVQDNCSLLREEEQSNTVCISGAPTNIIIFNDGSIRKRSTSSPCSVSLLADIDNEIEQFHNVEQGITEYNLLLNAVENLEYLTESIPSTELFQNHIEQDIASPLPLLNAVNNFGPIKENQNEVRQAQTSSAADSTSQQNDITDLADLPIRTRQKRRNPEGWKANKNKKQREMGQSYLGKKKINNKWSFVAPKDEKKIKDRCYCKLSLKGDTKLQCLKITEEERQKCFEKFWKMSWNEKKVYIRMSSIRKSKQRERCSGTSSRREKSVELYLTDSKGNRYRVCKKMFLNSLCIGEWVIKKWILQNDDNVPGNLPKNNTKKEAQSQLRRFFDCLPQMESHYCRHDTSKLYLEPIWTSKSQLYKAYINDFCPREQAEPLSIATFFNVFEELNLALFRPKKDLCDVCESFKTGNTTESEHKIHIDMKKEARQELKKDSASNNEVFTMDLQSVLLSPRSNVSALYYKTKLIVHNFTLYDVKRNKGYCYIWNEVEGSLTSNEFSTIIVTALGKFISQNPIGDDQQLILYSDGCTYQNRNAVLSNALLNFSMLNKITVLQKFLEKGHTQMECDSMHSVIERAIRNKKINVPADYAYLAKIACKKSPYEVEYLYHQFFKNMETGLPFYKSIRPGRKPGDPKVTNLRALKYVPDGKIVYKLRHADTIWEEFPTRMKKICAVPWNNIPQLYSSRLKIKNEKYLHLQELKNTMEKDYHKFYDNLPHF